MLPFLKAKQTPAVGVIVKTRPADETTEDQDTGDHAIHACARDLINAVHAKDEKGVAEALRAAFEIMDSSEGAEPNSYDAQNIKAGNE